jgi:hypothetical protein
MSYRDDYPILTPWRGYRRYKKNLVAGSANGRKFRTYRRSRWVIRGYGK